jgi:hypothetical protein
VATTEDPSICSDCARGRNFDELLWEMDAQNGDIDRDIG